MRTSSQYVAVSSSLSKSSPVSRSVNRIASTSALRLGCAVFPASEEKAQSTISTPSSAASRYDPICPPAESWVWKWIGTPTSCRSARTSCFAA